MSSDRDIGGASAYCEILAVLDSVPWDLAPEVTPIRPVGHKALNFFPGQRGYIGPEFPVEGVMIVANNFDSLKGWEDYKGDLEFEDRSPTWKRMKEIIVPESGIELEKFWFTNYCFGVLDNRDKDEKPDPCYSFPSQICKKLQFARIFERCVAVMQPRVVVALGGEAEGYLRYTRAEASTKIIAGHSTKVLSTYHTSARVTLEKFHLDAARIKRAYYSY